MKEFSKIDTNGDGTISEQELLDFMVHKVNEQKEGNQDHDFHKEIASSIFQEIDRDQSGTITIEEFVSAYLELQEMIQLRI